MYPGMPPFGPYGAAGPYGQATESEAHRVSRKYPIFARSAIKFAQLALGGAILGLVLGPMRGTSLYEFVTRTNTEWQGAVVGIVAVFAILTLLMFVSAFCLARYHLWRQVDALISATASCLYILVSCLEAYYAACYPPNGPKINLVCHRVEWIVATILCFFNLVFYIADLILALRTGVNLL
ncbi:hypothetical protein AAVH_04892 [Aphelenchoides avenae]|nr:hypothetical protein AAVH_04892 [Aphelenchus avenae]